MASSTLTRLQRRFVFDMFETLNYSLDAEDPGQVTAGMCSWIARQYNRPLTAEIKERMKYRSAADRVRAIKKVSINKEDVTRWLSRPEEFTPYIDEVAVSRAWNFDVKALDHLSSDERALLGYRLYVHPDQWDEGEGQVRSIVRGGGGTTSPRRMAYEALSFNEQQRYAYLEQEVGPKVFAYMNGVSPE